MEKIKTYNYSEVKNNINLIDYFIMPYYDQKNIVYIEVSSSFIKWYNFDLKQISPFKKINKSIQKFYNSSKFKNNSIFIVGFLNKIQNFRSLCVFDLLLKEQFDKKIQSKKYSIRYDNIRNRFLINIPKSIKNLYTVFAQKYTQNIKDISIKCIESNSWQGFSLYKDKPYNYYDNDYSLIINKMWFMKQGIITETSFTIDKDNKILLTCIAVEDSQKNQYKIETSINKIKIKSIDDVNALKNQKVLFKICNYQNQTFTKFLNFSKNELN